MPSSHERFRTEISAARAAYAAGDLDRAFAHLETAHIVGQLRFLDHAVAHGWMLRLGVARRDTREVFGQLLRLTAIVPGHLLGWLPIGNTGGANVSAVKPMPIPPDLAHYFEGFSLRRKMAQRGLAASLVVVGACAFAFALGL